MNKDIADRWIKDLRSNPPQSQRRLFDGNGYCCLGRLAVVMGRKPTIDGYDYKIDGESYVLSYAIRDEAGMHSQCGFYDHNNYDLTQANDDGMSFAQIADIIEEKWEEL